MALRLRLKPRERLIVSGAVIRNGRHRTELHIENVVPVLRERDILAADDARTPCQRIYLVIQLMYVDELNLKEHHNTYWRLVRDVISAAPSMSQRISGISEEILRKNFYQALKLAKDLIDYEQEVVSHAC